MCCTHVGVVPLTVVRFAISDGTTSCTWQALHLDASAQMSYAKTRTSSARFVLRPVTILKGILQHTLARPLP